jgi:hypothetical protein
MTEARLGFVSHSHLSAQNVCTPSFGGRRCEAGFVHVEHFADIGNLPARVHAIDPDVIPVDLEIPIAAAPVGRALSCGAQSFRNLRLCAAREPARVGSAGTGESAPNALK